MSCVDWLEPIAVPFGWLLMNLYNLVSNYVLALFLIAVIVRVILLPFQMKGKRGMLKQTRLQPKIAELQKKHGANKQKLNEEMAKLYKEEGVNPASGCLWSFIQMPIMIALFIAIRKPLTLLMGVKEELFMRVNGVNGRILEVLESGGITYTDETLAGFYSQINIAQDVSTNWDRLFAGLTPPIEGLQNISFNLGIVDFSIIPSYRVWEFPWGDAAALFPMLVLFLLPVFSGGAQFVSMHIMRKMGASGTPETAKGTAANVMKFMPLLSVWFGFIFPAALSFYWTIGTVLQIGQDIWLTKKYTKILDEEDAEKEKVRTAKEAELEAKRLETERLKAEGLAERNRNTSKRKKQKSEKQDQLEKAAEWEKKNAPADEKEEKDEPARVGKRRYARGRAYDPNRYDGAGFETDDDSYTGYDEDEHEDYEESDEEDEDSNDEE